MDAPAYRSAYDKDGSVGTAITIAGTVTKLTTSQLRALNGENEGAAFSVTGNRIAIIFPTPVDLAALYCPWANGAVVKSSKNSTTGVDGNWDFQANVVTAPGTKPYYRLANYLTPMQAGALSTGVRAVRVEFPADTVLSPPALHIYADVELTNIDALAYWDPTANAELPGSYFDWGDVARGSSADKSFRLKNTSPDKTASTISIYADALTPGVPSVAGMYSFSVDGGTTFRPNVTIDSLAPGQISDPVIVRRSTPTTAQVSTWSARISSDVGTWN